MDTGTYGYLFSRPTGVADELLLRVQSHQGTVQSGLWRKGDVKRSLCCETTCERRSIRLKSSGLIWTC